MKNLEKLLLKVLSPDQLINKVTHWKDQDKKIVFTNGCFDVLHRGHIELLAKTADLGDCLIVAINSDKSIRKLKGSNRPIIDESSRSIMISSLSFVDAVVLFDEETPLNLISIVTPHILSKGGDYCMDEIVGHEIVTANGGEVAIIPLVDGFSTTNIISRISKYNNG